MTDPRPIVYLLDDDPMVRASLSSLLFSKGRKIRTFADAAEFQSFRRPDAPACLILDLVLPGMSGLDLQRQLQKDEAPPVIILTGYASIPDTVAAMKAGAVEVLTKPFDADELLEVVDAAIATDAAGREARNHLKELKRRYDSLTPRERKILAYVVSGLLNKQTAFRVGSREITIRVHRGHIMKKMKADSLADLVRMAQTLGVHLVDR